MERPIAKQKRMGGTSGMREQEQKEPRHVMPPADSEQVCYIKERQKPCDRL